MARPLNTLINLEERNRILEKTKKAKQEASDIKEMKTRGEIFEVDPDASNIVNPSNLLKLDLACGGNKKEGFTGIDHVYNKGWNYNDNEFHIYDLDSLHWHTQLGKNSTFEINCSHYIEHVRDIKLFMEQCYYILCNGGIITFTAPYYTSIRAWQDFTHVRAISENTFLYFNQTWLIKNKLEHYDVHCNFDIVSIKYLYNPEYQPRSDDARDYARKHHINVVDDIIVVLRALKN